MTKTIAASFSSKLTPEAKSNLDAENVPFIDLRLGEFGNFRYDADDLAVMSAVNKFQSYKHILEEGIYHTRLSLSLPHLYPRKAQGSLTTNLEKGKLDEFT